MNLVGTMVAILDQVSMSSLRNFGVAVISRAQFTHKFDIMAKGMNFRHLAYTVALAVWKEEVDVVADATKHIM